MHQELQKNLALVQELISFDDREIERLEKELAQVRSRKHEHLARLASVRECLARTL